MVASNRLTYFFGPIGLGGLGDHGGTVAHEGRIVDE